MAVSYAWSFSELDVIIENAEGLADVVYTIHWRYSATDGEDPPHTATAIGTSSVKWEEGQPWIPYEDLTEADVQGWTEEQLGEERIEQMEASFDAQIAEQITPTHETMRGDELPWNEGDGD